MPGFRRTALAGAALATALTAGAILVACGGGGGGGAAAGVKLSVADSYIPLPAGDGMAAGYLTVRNTGGAADKLLKVSSPGAQSVTLHRSTDTTMQEVDSLPVPAGGSLELARGGNHLMIMGWAKPPALGDKLELDLTFQHGGTIAVQVPVEPLTYRPGS
ncbi:copper(I)-binding protein [Kitasatospora sp. MAA4]|uniref:copper chaperone PCu(A)C n=1 Tax=Kitasatospora sp. MAA4 TaxID=3035093 RepID=UPI002473ABAA|nr:copper chaperone PCu(A)C [Kitasatospora sp. MAA4]MDH6137385.1 copper(I)-binding protein [Kitasatospora sp. MAA4]